MIYNFFSAYRHLPIFDLAENSSTSSDSVLRLRISQHHHPFSYPTSPISWHQHDVFGITAPKAPPLIQIYRPASSQIIASHQVNKPLSEMPPAPSIAHSTAAFQRQECHSAPQQPNNGLFSLYNAPPRTPSVCSLRHLTHSPKKNNTKEETLLHRGKRATQRYCA
jgi:hypothetical protein